MTKENPLTTTFSTAQNESTIASVDDCSSDKLDRPVFVAYVTAGYPTIADTVEILLALQQGGADVIELGNLISNVIMYELISPQVSHSLILSLMGKLFKNPALYA